MFGKNQIRKVDHHPEDGKLAVQEIFYTIQGEGPFSGTPAVFIRLAGCHLACSFCDTEFESGINQRLTHEAVSVAAWASLGANTVAGLVVLTGGEPLRQGTAQLVEILLMERGFTHVQLETAGNLWDPELEKWIFAGEVSLVCSPKTRHIHPKIREYCRHWKYVVCAGGTADNGLPSISTSASGKAVPGRHDFRPGDTTWISPMDEHEPFKNAANIEHAVKVSMEHGYRLSLQLHKILGLR